MSENDVVDIVRFRVVDELLRRMSDRDFESRFDPRGLRKSAQPREVALEVISCSFDLGLGLDVVRGFGRSSNRQHVERRAESSRQLDSELERASGRLRAVVTHEDVLQRSASAAGGATGASGSASRLRKRWRGRKNAFAISVGTTALPMTAAIK